MKFARILQVVNHEPWLIAPAIHASIQKLLSDRVSGLFEVREGANICGDAVEIPQMTIQDGVAIIPIGGVIGSGLGSIEKGAGAVDVADVSAEIDQAVADPNVRFILFNIDSPGGTVQGTPELADKISLVQGLKPMGAYVSGCMCSGAYWIGSAAGPILASKSSSIGSIGVYIPWIDQTDAFAQAGLKVKLFTSGKYKGMGYPGTELTPEQQQLMESRVVSIARMFYAQVRAMRGEVADSTMQGQTFLAEEALQLNLIDGVCSGIDEAIAILAGTQE